MTQKTLTSRPAVESSVATVKVEVLGMDSLNAMTSIIKMLRDSVIDLEAKNNDLQAELARERAIGESLFDDAHRLQTELNAVKFDPRLMHLRPLVRNPEITPPTPEQSGVLKSGVITADAMAAGSIRQQKFIPRKLGDEYTDYRGCRMVVTEMLEHGSYISRYVGGESWDIPLPTKPLDLETPQPPWVVMTPAEARKVLDEIHADTYDTPEAQGTTWSEKAKYVKGANFHPDYLKALEHFSDILKGSATPAAGSGVQEGAL